jgi:transposase-like protein
MALDVLIGPVPCPKCKSIKNRVMPFSEQEKFWHWFLRCAACGYEWTVAKRTRTQLAARVVHASAVH